MSKARSKMRRGSIVTSASETLRETLSAFGDDVVRIKDPRQLNSTTRNEEQSGSGNFMGINPSGMNFNPQGQLGQDSERIMSSQMKFERVPSSEVGVRSSRWRKAVIAGLFSSRKPDSSRHGNRESPAAGDGATGNGLGDEGSQEISRGPPFWGVGADRRAKVSTLTLQILLHEIACFASAVLLGCLIVQGFEGISWIKSPEMKSNWLFSRLYGSFSTLLLVLSSLGFLIRMDTTQKSTLLTLPLLLIPTGLLTVTEYLNKSWELQKQECLNYFKMDEISRKEVHLTQDCQYYENNNNYNYYFTDFGSIIMRICPVVLCFGISLYLFICRTSFYLIRRFADN